VEGRVSPRIYIANTDSAFLEGGGGGEDLPKSRISALTPP
jgi:hypothetical protein